MLSQHSRVSRFIAIILLFMLSLAAIAQNPLGRIVGVVTDPTGAVVSNAAILVTNEATNVQYSTNAGTEGSFVVPSLPAGLYTVQILVTGFNTAAYKNVKVDAGKEYSITARLELKSGNQTVEVVAGQELVNTTTSELSNTVNTAQIQNLPLNGRDIIGLISTQAGVGSSGRASTTINGTRPSWSQVTLDGINIQDLYIRTNALDYIPNRPTTDTVSEFTINSSTQGVNATLGATGVRMVTPSGSNAFHGSLYEYNRNAAVAANSWFNNYSGVKKPPYNRNEFGATLGGPVVKNKLFFYGYYAGLRTRTQSSLNQVVPAYDDYLNGQFRYVPSSGPLAGTVQTINVMNLAGGTAGTTPTLTLDAAVQAMLKGTPSASLANNYQVGNSNSSRLLNTAGRTITQAANNDRDNFGFKLDYEVSQNHHLDFTYSHMHEVTLRPDYDSMQVSPRAYNDSSPQLFSGGWRWTINNTFINTVRIGANLAPAPFITTGGTNPFLLSTGANSPYNYQTLSGIGLSPTFMTLLPQGRKPAVHQYMDDATWVKGAHNFSFGGSFQNQNIYSYTAGGTVPTYTTGFDYAPSTYALTAANFSTPISSSDLASANALRAFLAGYLASGSQSFYSTSKTSGYVPGAQQDRNLSLRDFSFYAMDQWRLRSNVTMTLGVKWEYVSPYNESNGLMVGPVLDSNAKNTLLTTTPNLDFLKQPYHRDLNNFGPSVGIAWDPFGNGKTSIRGGYTLTYVNDDIYRFTGNAVDYAGTSAGAVEYYGLNADGTNHFLSAGAPTIAAPTFTMPMTYADLLNINPASAVWAIDPKVHTPMVHQISFGIERELPKNMSISARYVGTLARDLLRGLDLNQNNAGINQSFMDDFARARSNGFLALAATGSFNPAYNSAIAGSQQLTIIPNVGLGGYITNSTVRTYIQQNAVADLANFYVSNRPYFPSTPGMFLPNPGIFAIDYGTNGAQSSYHALQVEAKRRLASGLQWQANYTWSKDLSTSPYGETGQTRFDPLLDNARPQLSKAPAAFDLRHAVKMNVIYDLPFGKGKMFGSDVPGAVDKIIGGWQLSGIYTWQSGNPFAILDTRGTFNRSARTTTMSPVSTLSQSQIIDHFGIFKTSTGIYYIDPSLMDPSTGKGVGVDNLNNTATYANQVFFNPTAGNIGNLGYLAFNGPSFQSLDLGLAKTTSINERFKLMFRADAFNFLNHPTFYVGDQNVNSTTFGKITGTNTTARQVQFGLRLTF